MKTSSRSSKRKSKRSQKLSKKKTRSSREKTNKLKQEDHSVSCTDEDSISNSVSGSSPVEENRGKKRGRSRDGKRRKDTKRRKKSDLLSESSGDESPGVKKLKKSKKSRGSGSKKKRNVKRRRRDRSVSSSSSRSRSCSSNDDFEGKEENVEVKERKGREKNKERKRRRRDRSLSSSSSPSRGRLFEKIDGSEGKEEKVELKERKGREKGKKRKGRRSLSSSSSPSRGRLFEQIDGSEGKEEKVELKERRGREKGRKRKGRKRGKSISSSSSRSRSHYLCEANDDREIECEGKEEEVESKGLKGREKGKERNAGKRSGDRSRSLSPCSLQSESFSYHSEERGLEKNCPKRLKSIVVMKEREIDEEQSSNRDDGHKDEIVCEFDGYTSKSNGTNDGVCGRDARLYSHYVSSGKRSLEEPNRESVASDVRVLEVPAVIEVPAVRKEFAVGSVGMTPSYVRSEADDPLMETRSEVCIPNAGSIREDLERILRQKALENLLKRQGKLSTKIPTDVEVKKSSIVKAQPVDQVIPYDEENIVSVHKLEKVVDHVRYISNSHSPSKDNDGRLLSMEVETAPPDEKGKAPGVFVKSRSDVGISTSRKELLRPKNTWKRQLSLQEKSQKRLSVTREMIANDPKQPLNSPDNSLPNLSGPQETIGKDSTRDPASPRFDSKGSTEDTAAIAASEPSASGEQNIDDKTNEADKEGQFQQKTMSVMRGGEMVQVSYKVYIPKKAPALARRQLKR